jgi:hypothetical protein
MKKRTTIQVVLLIAAALYMGWGLTLLLAPSVSHGLVSTGPYDPSVTAMFGATLLGMMVTFVIAAYDPEKEIVRASAVGMAFVGFTAAYLIFVAKVMPLQPLPVISMFIDLAACGILFLTEMRIDLAEQEGNPEGMHKHHA